MADLRVAPGRARIAAAPPLPGDLNRTVIIVDDEASVRTSCGGGWSLAATPSPLAPGADEALRLLEPPRPTAVALCDLRMPGHDGLWLADQLRREHPDTAVIIATGVNDAGSPPSRACARGSSTI